MPDWSDPHDPAWETPHMRSFSVENLIAFGEERFGPADLTFNDRVQRGVDAMYELGYDLTSGSEIGKLIDDATGGERGYHFTRRPVEDAGDIQVLDTDEMVAMGKTTGAADPPAGVNVENYWTDQALRSDALHGWLLDGGQSLSTGDGHHLFVFRRERSK